MRGCRKGGRQPGFRVSPCTAHRWKSRWLAASDRERRSGRWALDRSSRPHRSPRRTAVEVEQRVVAERERTGWGPRLIAGQTGVAHSTVHAILRRHGRSRAPRAPRERSGATSGRARAICCTWTSSATRAFAGPGTAFIDDERQTSQELGTRLGYDYCHAIVDDHSRLAYGELLADTRAPTVTAFTSRALAWFAARGINGRPGDDRRRLELHATTARCANCSPSARSARSSPRPTRHAGTARSNACTRRWTANGRAASATATAAPATARCNTGCATTTTTDPTAHSAGDHRSPALSTSKGTTPTQPQLTLAGEPANDRAQSAASATMASICAR